VSFARFSNSDIYMFEHVGGFIECCGCWFVDWDAEFYPQLKTPREALTHLDSHEKAGHDIGNARNRIIDTYDDLDVEIDPYVTPSEVIERVNQKMRAFQEHPPQHFRDRSNGE